MKVTLESTSHVVTVNGGVPARIWEGQTESGVKVFCLVTRVAIALKQDCSEFDRELLECRAPSDDTLALFPLRIRL